MEKWNRDDIYAISFLVTFNELNVYDGVKNFPEISIGYNTEEACDGAPLFSEDRWNYACWEQNNEVILDCNDTVGANLLLRWFAEYGISCLDDESDGEMYGKDPAVFWNW